jgi:YfiH family protein
MPEAFRKSGGVYRAAALDALEWVEHGFGTRDSAGWPDPERTVSLRQIHSDIVLNVNGELGCIGAGDALVSGCPGALLTIRTADCLPILMVEEERRVVAAVHAGWRGTASDVVVRAVEVLCQQFAGKPERLCVAIGPGIGKCCYEVGPEVALRFAPLFPELAGARGKVPLDLAEANRRQLLAAGVPAVRIHTGAPCTSCRAEEFYSYRREPERRGRMISAIGVKMS